MVVGLKEGMSGNASKGEWEGIGGYGNGMIVILARFLLLTIFF